MPDATFTELRNNAKEYFDRVEGGETVRVYRRGKLVALLVPPGAQDGTRVRKPPLSVPGVSLSRAILAEREES